MSPVRSFAILGAALVVAACGSDAGRGASSSAARSESVPARTAVVSGLLQPESARYDSAADVFYVSNINGAPPAKDGNGFISRVRPDGTIDSLHFIAGGRNGVTLNAPKGMALVGDTLWVADIDAVRGFDKRTGAPVATIDLTREHALFLNDVVAAPDGSLYVTDMGVRFDASGAMTHPEGSDRIFRIAPDHSVSVALATDALARPNGITWDARAKRFVIVSYGGPTILAWHPGDTTVTTIGYGRGEMDGVEMLPDGRMVVTSWKDSSVTIRSGNKEMSVKAMPSPADLGVDVRRNVLAVPLLGENRLELWSIPKQQ